VERGLREALLQHDAFFFAKMIVFERLIARWRVKLPPG
jgi:hypothetical protein